MKEQEAFQNKHAQERRQETEKPREAIRTPEQIPLQAYAQLLSGRADITGLPEPFLQALAQAVGNDCLTELLRGGGLEEPAFHTPEMPEGEDGLSPNEIRTEPPRLATPAAWDGSDGGRPQPARPQGLVDRGFR